MGLGQYNANPNPKSNRFYFTGTTKLRKGQVLVLDSTASKTDSNPQNRLGSAVVDIAASASNKNLIAGIVDADAGKTGPCFVELTVPAAGEVVDVEVDGTTAVSALDVLKGDDAKGALIKDASAAPGVTWGRALEAQSTAAKVIIRVFKF